MTELQRGEPAAGPEVVVHLAHERAPDGCTGIHQVIPVRELAETAARCPATGAVGPATVNRGSP
ncbi:hypothetical protein ACWDZ6_27435 [Streptomyces sp. NPDC002926]